jgi:hypothetical protein
VRSRRFPQIPVDRPRADHYLRQLESEANAFDRVIRAIVRVLQPA